MEIPPKKIRVDEGEEEEGTFPSLKCCMNSVRPLQSEFRGYTQRGIFPQNRQKEKKKSIKVIPS